jgi:hypothetical protein
MSVDHSAESRLAIPLVYEDGYLASDYFLWSRFQKPSVCCAFLLNLGLSHAPLAIDNSLATDERDLLAIGDAVKIGLRFRRVSVFS